MTATGMPPTMRATTSVRTATATARTATATRSYGVGAATVIPTATISLPMSPVHRRILARRRIRLWRHTFLHHHR